MNATPIGSDTQPINTKTASHRTLRFSSLDDALAEVDRLIGAERTGSLRATGNWTIGQALGHLALWINMAYDGYPPQLNPPWIVKQLLRLRKAHYLRADLPRGFRIPKIPGGTLGIEPLSTEEGAARFRAAAQRLRTAPPTAPNIIFGPLTHEEWTRLHLSHATLHLGYFWPSPPPPSA